MAVSAVSKITTLNNYPILTGKKYVVDIYKRKNHAKNHFDWMKTEGSIEVWSLLYSWTPGSRFQVNLILRLRFSDFFFHFEVVYIIYFDSYMKKSCWNTFSDVWLKKAERPFFGRFFTCDLWSQKYFLSKNFFYQISYYLILKV